MCTVSVIPISRLGSSGYRLISNRDESPLRARAEVPIWRAFPNGVRAIWPTDPEGLGTWIAGNTSGLTLTLLNRNGGPTESTPTLNGTASRGSLIPQFISASNLAEVGVRLSSAILTPFSPFRLLGVDLGGGMISCQVWTWNGVELSDPSAATVPLCLASSGLGDSRVLPRLDVFSDIVRGNPCAAAQDAFHRHRWPDRPEISVLMNRNGARTVSITTCEVNLATDGSLATTMDYTEVEAPGPQNLPQLVRRAASV